MSLPRARRADEPNSHADDSGFEATTSVLPTLPRAPMTLHQLADYLGIGEAVARRLCRIQKIPAFKVGGQWRVLPDDVTDFILTQLQKK